MRNKLLFKKAFFILLFALPVSIFAQTVKGKLTDAKGKSVPFATIVEKGTSNGTTTDENGNFEFKVSKIPTTIQVSSVGYSTKDVLVNSNAAIAISIKEESVGLDEVVVTGNRAKPRTILNSPVPIDNIGLKDLKNSGKTTIERMLTFKVPSFNSQNQAISDATAHYDPQLHNMVLMLLLV